MRRWLEFLLLATIALTALAIGAVQAPPRLRSIVPIPLAYGVLGGALLAGLAAMTGLERRRSSIALAATLLLLGLAGATIERWRVQVAELKARRLQEVNDDDRKKAAEDGAQSALARRMLEAATPPEDPKLRAEYEETLREIRKADEDIRTRLSEEGIGRRVDAEASFWNWLNSRQLRRGQWQAPWPALFTLGELCASTLIGAWVFARMVARHSMS